MLHTGEPGAEVQHLGSSQKSVRRSSRNSEWLTRELLSLRGGIWLWSGTATAAMALGLVPVSTRTSCRFQGSSGRLSPGNSYVLTDLRFCTSSSLPTQTAVEQAGTLHLFPGEAAYAVKQL